jgi:long-chain acyl-CoA synthetase
MYAELRKAWDELTSPGAPFEIHEIDIRGVRMRAFANAPRTLRDVWLASQSHAEADHLVFEDDRWTFAEAHRDVASIAAWLVAQGIEPGDRVAIAMRNYPEWLLVYWASLSIGAIAVGMNAWWTSEEMAYALNDSEPKVLACDDERLERYLPIRGEVPPMIAVGVRCAGGLPTDTVPFAELLGGGALPGFEPDPDADACLFYTSGTTGHPKGARLTHRSCTNNLWSMAFFAAAQLRARQLAGVPKPPADAQRPAQTTSLLTTPLFHVTANNCAAHGATMNGGKLVLMYKWDATRALQLIERERVTTFGGVPTMARELLAHPELDRYDTSSLSLIGGGGAKFQSDLVRKVEARKGRTRANTGYGLTETSGIITANAGDFLADKAESVGPAMPCFETRCVDDDGNEVAPGQPGELWVKGAQVVAGYWNKPEATAEAITEGWFHTGDIAVIDEDGFIEIVDRKKDMVLRGGENVFCSEVESALFRHPDVAECAVFGVPDDRLGEEVAAAVVPREGAEVSADALRTCCAQHIAKHKIPRYVWQLDEALPRNANGKYLKRELRERLALADADDALSA